MTLFAGTRLGPYEILSPLGAGGMGEVYRARDTRLLRDVAIKVLPEALHGDDEALSRFEREARAIAALSHLNILAIHDFGREGSVSYSVTELLEGETLRTASNLGSDGADTASPTVGGTTPGVVLGTVGYMSPEQVRGEPADARTDIFALGCMLYEMLTGRRAFQGTTAAEVFAGVLRDEPAALTEASGGIPAEAVPILRHCLEKNPEQRYQTARDLAFGLRELGSGTF